MSLAAAFLLGLVQAATEFLPVSSTAHLLVFGELLGQRLSDERFRAFVAVIQAGTTLAVVAYFRTDLARLAAAALGSLRRLRPLETPVSRLAWWIALGTVPAAALGKLLEERIEALGNAVIALSLVAWALVLVVAESRSRQERGVEEMGAADAIWVGLAQAAALVPGTSRSGSTIAAGMLLGLRREAAARYSFLLSVPITLGAGFYKLGRVLPALRAEPAWALAAAVGTIVSFLFGLAVIAWLLRWLRTRTLWLFVGWRLAAAAVVAGLLWTGTLPASDEWPPPPAAGGRR
ncbi:MAG TPA: undecaprenyl-diphosphatase UppP [Anaeromyxobacteraceae bacterium]|jgi:undecaprenyl-diphosphatase